VPTHKEWQLHGHLALDKRLHRCKDL